HPGQGPGSADHGLLFLLSRSESRCGRPGLSQPSLRAFTYTYSSWIAVESSSTFHAGMPLAARPFHAVLTTLSRGKFAPAGLTARSAWSSRPAPSLAVHVPRRRTPLRVHLDHRHVVLLQDLNDVAAPAVDHRVERGLELFVAVSHRHRHGEREWHPRHRIRVGERHHGQRHGLAL